MCMPKWVCKTVASWSDLWSIMSILLFILTAHISKLSIPSCHKQVIRRKLIIVISGNYVLRHSVSATYPKLTSVTCSGYPKWHSGALQMVNILLWYADTNLTKGCLTQTSVRECFSWASRSWKLVDSPYSIGEWSRVCCIISHSWRPSIFKHHNVSA
jgi:hypothetical protein